MHAHVAKLPRVIVAVIAGLALTAGAYTVAPRSASSCPVSPPHLLGACTSKGHCQDMCDVHWGEDNSEGICSPHPETGELCCGCMAI
jgi:hypothetical protein